MLPDKIKDFIVAIEESLTSNTFVSITLGNYKGSEEHLKNIYIKKTIIKAEEKLSFTYRYKTKDIVKNFDIKEAVEQIQIALQDGFKFATLFTTESDQILEQQKNGNYLLKKITASKSELPSLSHDKIKNHPITAKGKPYLTELKITDANGNVFKATQDKYKQINHYIEILSSLLKELPEKDLLNVVDMGSGKGYLTFALYDYLTNVLNKKAKVTGVEFRKDLVDLCNKISTKSNFTNLFFEEGSIEKYENDSIDVLIALHACDTATDDAIAKGIAANASLIVVAPCCHKQIRREIEKYKQINDIDFITKHGIFLERQAEMVTDAIRAMVLEYFGYKTKVFEFITDAHTPKNIMITGIKSKSAIDKETILQKIKDAKKYFGIQQHYLEKAIGI
ncbi:class I SAM-dependent methyltransferase [Ferruginibacter sp. SUN002]|uniref:class I SAM-dependent methyltransferase n=1 Tax=Ferruginibacter sp. SUN002 TaxID=2937789 RepID=UPI003D36479D